MLDVPLPLWRSKVAAVQASLKVPLCCVSTEARKYVPQGGFTSHRTLLARRSSECMDLLESTSTSRSQADSPACAATSRLLISSTERGAMSLRSPSMVTREIFFWP
jgi:hypothetical protein